MSRSRRPWSTASPLKRRSRIANSSSSTFGIADKWPVLTEPYCQWVIEDTFSDGRPPLDEVGAEFVADVSDHKLVKTRLLNGTHIALACLATLAGYQRTDEAMADDVIFDYVEQLMRDEIQPLLPAVPGMNTPDYRNTLLARLSNPQMSDQLSRLARRGTSKISQFVLPSLQEAIAQGRPHTLLMLAVAGWARYMRGHDLKGRKFRIEDSQAIPVVRLATMASNNPDPLLGHEMFAEVRAVPGFAERLGDMIADIDEHGVIPTLRRALRDDARELVVVMNRKGLTVVREFDPAPITTLLCDADDNLFPSERPAFAASTEVTNRFLARFGVTAPLSAEELRKRAVGKNFRTTAVDLAVQCEVPIEQTLAQGRPEAVSLRTATSRTVMRYAPTNSSNGCAKNASRSPLIWPSTLKPDPQVLEPLRDLATQYALAAVSSSAIKRLHACFTATGLDPLIPPDTRFSAEDSLPVPTSKPDPAVYLHAGQVLGVDAHQGLAIEDSVAGATSAVAAGYVTVGNVMFVPDDERDCRRAELIDAGAVAITDSWRALADVLLLSTVTAGGSPLT